jgi:hypothetical protein
VNEKGSVKTGVDIFLHFFNQLDFITGAQEGDIDKREKNIRETMISVARIHSSFSMNLIISHVNFDHILTPSFSPRKDSFPWIIKGWMSAGVVKS